MEEESLVGVIVVAIDGKGVLGVTTNPVAIQDEPKKKVMRTRLVEEIMIMMILQVFDSIVSCLLQAASSETTEKIPFSMQNKNL